MMKMEMLENILSILVAVGVVIGYLKSTLTTTIHSVVDKMFSDQQQVVDRMFADQRLSIDRQTQTLDMLDKTIAKMDVVIEKVSEHQYSMDKDLAMLDKDVRALHRRVDDHEDRMQRFCSFCNEEHKGDMPPELFNMISYGHNRRGRDEE